MIKSLEIKNFKSIRSLSVDLPTFAVLVGPNGSGKTNIVQALELFGEILQRGTTDPVREQGWAQIIRRGKKPARGGITLGVKVSRESFAKTVASRTSTSGLIYRSTVPVSGAGITLTASVTLEGSSEDETVRVRKEELLAETSADRLRVTLDDAGWHVNAGANPRIWDLFHPNPGSATQSWKTPDDAVAGLKQLLGVGPGRARSEDPTILRLLNRVRFGTPWLSALVQASRVSRFRLDASSLRSDAPFRDAAALLGPSGEGLAAAVDKLRGRSRDPAPAFKRVLAALQKVYPRIEDVRAHRIQPGRLTLVFRERGIEDDLGVMNISDGVLHALALLVMLEGDKDRRATGVLAIEEPENAIHPWSVRTMMERAQTSSRQVLVTTHSETVVNAVKDPGSLFIVENDDRKGTIVTPARDKERALDAILSETGQRLGDVWMDGSLGGVPGQ